MTFDMSFHLKLTSHWIRYFEWLFMNTTLSCMPLNFQPIETFQKGCGCPMKSCTNIVFFHQYRRLLCKENDINNWPTEWIQGFITLYLSRVKTYVNLASIRVFHNIISWLLRCYVTVICIDKNLRHQNVDKDLLFLHCNSHGWRRPGVTRE